MDEDHKDDSPLPEVSDRFAGALELDTSPDDETPERVLWRALAAGDAERAMGAYRLLEAAGRGLDLEPTLALELADLLEKHDRFLDAARICRAAAEADLDGPEAPAATLRGAKLLLGPARHPDAGLAMLRFYLDRYPDHRLRDEARDLLARAEAGEDFTQDAPVAAGVAAHNLAAPGQAPADPEPVARGSSAARAIQALTGPVGSGRYRLIARAFVVLFLLTAATWAVSWLLRDRLQSVDDIDPSLAQAPQQTKISDRQPIRFTRDGYAYTLTPTFDYTINGLIVSLRDYTFMSYRKSDSVFPMDLCMIWGSNVGRKVHQSGDVEFSQHGRFCIYKYEGRNRIRGSELSNTHVLLADEDMERTLFSLGRGDQIRMKGQLVNVEALLLERGGSHDAPRFKLNSSIVRTDTGGGACEVMYVRELEVLRPAHPLARAISQISFWILLGLLGLFALRLILLPVRIRETR